MSSSAPIVFIASTCYDLADLRAELRQHLEKDGFIVRLSDDFDSDFRVDPSVDSIESCLANLRTSDIALFIFDRRYGPPLGREYGDRSATHLEFTTAVDHKMKILSFVRKQTMGEFDQWRGNSETFSPRWTDKKRYTQLFRLIQEVRDLHNPEGRSNWIDLFESSPDLRTVASKRLYDVFPALAGGRALTRERVVRLTFTAKPETDDNNVFRITAFRVKNAGLTVAADVQIVLQADGNNAKQTHLISVIPVDGESERFQFKLDNHLDYTIVCRYSNLWGDKYEISMPFNTSSGPSETRFGPEKFRVVRSAE